MILLPILMTFPKVNSVTLTEPSRYWEKTYGGYERDEAYSIVQTIDGGYAMAGFTASYGDSDFDAWLVKVDADGNIQWNKTYGGELFDVACSVVQTSDGGFVVGGTTASYGEGHTNDFWLIKTDFEGNVIWNNTYGRINSDESRVNDELGSMVKTRDGGFALVGFTLNLVAYQTYSWDFWLVKTDANGNKQWDRLYDHVVGGDSYSEFRPSLVETDDNGFALLGETYGNHNSDFWLVKTDSNGNKQWDKTYGQASYDELPHSIIQTNDRGFALVGENLANNRDYFLVKTDANGNMQWNKTYGGNFLDIAYSIVQTDDNGFAIAGTTNSFKIGTTNRYPDAWLVKTDSEGNMQWNKAYGGNGDERVQSIIITNDGGFAMAGDTDSFGAGERDIYLIKVDMNSTQTSDLEVTISSNRDEVKQRFNDVQLTINVNNIGNYLARNVTIDLHIPNNFETQSPTTWNGDIQPGSETTMQVNTTCKSCLTSIFTATVTYLNDTGLTTTISKEKIISGDTWIIIDDFDEEGYTDISLSLTHVEKAKSLKTAENTIAAVWINKIILGMPGSAEGLLDYADSLFSILKQIIKEKEVDPEIIYYLSEIVFSIGLNTIGLRMDARNPNKYNLDGTLTYRVVWWGKATGTILQKVIKAILEIIGRIIIEDFDTIVGLLDTQGKLYLNACTLDGQKKFDTFYGNKTAVTLVSNLTKFNIEVDARETEFPTENYTLFILGNGNQSYIETKTIQRGKVQKFNVEIDNNGTIQINEVHQDIEPWQIFLAVIVVLALGIMSFVYRKRKHKKPET